MFLKVACIMRLSGIFLCSQYKYVSRCGYLKAKVWRCLWSFSDPSSKGVFGGAGSTGVTTVEAEDVEVVDPVEMG